MRTYLRLVFCSVAALRACKELSLRRDYNGTLSGHSDGVWQHFSMPFLPSNWHFIEWCPVKLSRSHTGLNGMRLRDMYNGVAKIEQRVIEWQSRQSEFLCTFWYVVLFQIVHCTLSTGSFSYYLSAGIKWEKTVHLNLHNKNILHWSQLLRILPNNSWLIATKKLAHWFRGKIQWTVAVSNIHLLIWQTQTENECNDH